jgi:glycopeptide antibiotics resistance protein
MLNRSAGVVGDIEMLPFWSYRQYFLEKNTALLGQMIFTVFAFIPWPILFAQVFPKMKKFLWGVGSAFLFSVFVEITQLVFKLGMFEFDDMFHNTLGALIGYAILTLVRAIILKYRSQKSN